MPNNIEKELESLKLEVQFKRHELLTSNGSFYFYKWLMGKLIEILKKAKSSQQTSYPDNGNL